MKLLAVIFGLIALASLCHREVEAEVNQCYYCNVKCEDPVQKTNCSNSQDFSYKCWSQVYQAGGNEAVLRGCVLDTATNKATCDSLNKIEGSSCSICDEDLCNSAVLNTFSLILLISVFFFLGFS